MSKVCKAASWTRGTRRLPARRAREPTEVKGASNLPRPFGAEPRQAEQTRDERDPDHDRDSAPRGRRLHRELRARRGRPRDPVERPSLDHRRVLLRPHEERYSTNIKERRDHSASIMDVRGRLVAQSEQSLPLHIASMSGLMESVLEKFGDDLHDGDLFVANDPYVAGGTHLPDVNLALPVFSEGTLVGFVCNIAHHADIGGMAPGSMAGGMTEIYQEGLRIPVVRLFRRGRAPAGPPRPPPPQCAGPPRATRRLLRPGRGLPARRPPAARARGGAGRGHRDARVRADDGTLRTATAERNRDRPDGTYEFEDRLDSDGTDRFDLPSRVRIEVAGDASALTSPAPRGRCRGT